MTTPLDVELETLRQELAEAQEALEAIRTGAVDALVVATESGQERIFTLEGADFAYRALIERMHEGAATLSGTGLVLYANGALAGLCQRPLEQLVGTDFHRLFLTPDDAWIQELVGTCLASGQEGKAQVLIARPDGRPIPVAVSLFAFDAYQTRTLVVTVADLTEHLALSRAQAQRESEAALRASEQRYRALVDLSPEPIAVHAEGRWVFGNRAALDLFGAASLEAFIGTPVLMTVAQSDHEAIAGRIHQLASGQQARTPLAETRIRRLDGVLVEVEASAIALEFEHRPGILVVLRDISARKRAETAQRESDALFQALFEQSLDAVFLTVPDGGVLRANPAACALFGRTEEEFQQVGRPGIVDATDPRHARALVERQRTGRVRTELHYLRQNGESFPAEVSSVVLSGEPPRSFVVLHDITERKQAEAALLKAKDTLEQAVAERTAELQLRAQQLTRLASELSLAEQRERQRLAVILHDHIQQLLAAAQFGLAGLAGRLPDPGLLSACDRITNTIKEAIQASRSLATELSPPVLHAKGLLAAVEWLARQMQERQGLHVEVASAGDLQTLAPHLRDFLFGALREILFNVVKHAGVDDAQVRLVCLDGTIEITVQDHGAGFDVGRTELASGTGLGLFSIRERLGYLGGRLLVESEPGRGSRIRLIAPSGPVRAPAPVEVLPAVPLLLRPADPHRKISLILADDHAVVRQSLALLLEAQPDLEVVGQAGDGEQAVELARTLRPDVVVMDITMARMDGIEATRLISSRFPDVAVIGLSMHEDPTMEEAIRAAGAVEYATKGGDTERLITAIRAVARLERGPSERRDRSPGTPRGRDGSIGDRP